MPGRTLASALRGGIAAVLLILGLAPALVAQSDLAGRWNGLIEAGGRQLEMVLVLRAGEPWSGTVDVPAQGDYGRAVTELVVTADSVTYSIPGIPGDPSFAGEVRGDSIVGVFAQGGGEYPLRFVRAEVSVSLVEADLDAIDAFVEEVRTAWDVPGVAVAVVKDGVVAHLAGYGYRDLEAELPVTERTLFPIGSSTKAFTAAAVGLLVDEGALDWDDPVRAHLPEFALADTAIAHRVSVRDVLTHRSGLPRHDVIWYADPNIEREELLARMAHLAPTADLRTTWQYNNFGYLTAGVVVERLSGRSWEDFVRTRIFRPLGMERSNFDVLTLPEADDFARGYGMQEEEVRRLPYRAIPGMGPAGSINSSAEEMAAWVQLQLALGMGPDGRLLATETVREMQNPHMVVSGNANGTDMGATLYGLGWFIETYRGHYRVQHGGNIDGFSALVDLYPEEDLGIVVLTNMNGTPTTQFIARGIADRLLEMEPRDASAAALAARNAAAEAGDEASDETGDEAAEGPSGPHAHPLEAYTGEYAHPGYGIVTVRVEDGELRALYGVEDFPLEHLFFEVFALDVPTSPFDAIRVRFETGLDGEVDALLVGLEPTAPPTRLARVPDASTTSPEFLATLVGQYRFSTQTISFAMRGDQLTVTIPGQPTYHLEPVRELVFGLEEAPDSYRVRFDLDDDGNPVAATFIQPNGTFRYERLEGGGG